MLKPVLVSHQFLYITPARDTGPRRKIVQIENYQLVRENRSR